MASQRRQSVDIYISGSDTELLEYSTDYSDEAPLAPQKNKRKRKRKMPHAGSCASCAPVIGRHNWQATAEVKTSCPLTQGSTRLELMSLSFLTYKVNKARIKCKGTKKVSQMSTNIDEQQNVSQGMVRRSPPRRIKMENLSLWSPYGYRTNCHSKGGTQEKETHGARPLYPLTVIPWSIAHTPSGSSEDQRLVINQNPNHRAQASSSLGRPQAATVQSLFTESDLVQKGQTTMPALKR